MGIVGNNAAGVPRGMGIVRSIWPAVNDLSVGSDRGQLVENLPVSGKKLTKDRTKQTCSDGRLAEHGFPMLKPPQSLFARRLAVLLLLLGVAVAGCVVLAVVVTREASGTVGRLAAVELESSTLARAFRMSVNDLHGGLLRQGGEGEAARRGEVGEQRKQLTRWLVERQAARHGEAERQVLTRFEKELALHGAFLDALAVRPGGPAAALSRAQALRLEEFSVKLTALADDFDAVHDAEVRALLVGALDDVQQLRTIIFGCLGLLVAAAGAVGGLLYRDLVRPLRGRLIESEALLAKREKLAALGTLAAGVAHEIRNPLTAIKARLFTLRRYAPAPEAQEDTRAIAGEIDRLEGIVREVLGYARPAEPKLAELELAGWLRELAAFEEPVWRARGIAVTVEAPEPVRVRADAGQLRQIVLNLSRNAADAFAGRSGRITLAVQAARWTDAGRSVVGARLTVADDGPGIPLAQQARLFDPFFTTKAAGTGLGLSIVAQLVAAHGGRISFQSAPGAGTRFEVCLPAQPPEGKIASE